MSDLPPLELSQAYVVVGPNDQRGPYAMELLISEVLAGRLSDETPVWWPGLPDWTTMGSHPGVAGELQRRRAVAAPPVAAPGWADPGAAAQPAAPAPAHEAPAEQAPYQAPVEASAPGADPFATQVLSEPLIEAAPVEAIVAESGEQSDAEIEDAEIEDAVVIEDAVIVTDSEVIEVTSAVVVGAHHVEAYSALVSRSSARAQAQERIDAVNDRIVEAVIGAAEDQGFELAERVDVERANELRFDAPAGDLLMVSLGRATAGRPEDIRTDHVPITVSYRSGSFDGGPDAGDGSHGEVRIVADEWTGQATSTVSLFLGLEDYLDEDLTVNTDAVALDVAATIAVVRGKLS